MKHIFILIMLMVSLFSVYSQNEDYHWYENNGKLYYNKNVPVYFWISTSANDNSKDVLMTSQSTKKYANPMYFDTEGYNTFQVAYAVDTVTKKVAYPSQNAVFKIYIDGYAPTLNAFFQGSSKYYSKGVPVYSANLTVKLTATDYTSGVEKIMYSINNKEYVKYSEPIKFTESGDFELKFFATDNTGNQSKEKSYKFKIK